MKMKHHGTQVKRRADLPCYWRWLLDVEPGSGRKKYWIR
jgi:hypothetical protein